MNGQFIKSGYHITSDPQFQNQRYGITPWLASQFEPLFIECQNRKNKKIIDKLTQLIIEHPLAPQLKNYLSVAYETQGKPEKAIEVNNRILAEHPDYLFGLLNQCFIFIQNGEYDKVPAILGDTLELKNLYPDRDLFHLAEVTGFYKLVICYFTAMENLELAENRFEILQEIAPEHPDTEYAETFLFELRRKCALARWKEEEKRKITPQMIKKVR